MKQTAVEWLCEQYHLKQDIEIVKQAKEMEKQQIIEAYHRGYANAISVPNKEYNPEQYYNETFNK
jgi:hypothetical protein